MSTSNPSPSKPSAFGSGGESVFGGGGESVFGSGGGSVFGGGGGGSILDAIGPAGPDPESELWDEVTDMANMDADGDPELVAKRVLTEVEVAFKERAAVEQRRMEEAVDSEYWVCVIFQSRAQKDEFLKAAGVEPDVMGDKYIDGPTLARLVGRPVTPVQIRYNISDKLDRRLVEMSRGLDELPGLGGPQTSGE